MRLDSFFFTKEFLNDEKIIEKQAHISIRETQAVLRSFGAYSLNNEVSYLSEGIPFIRGVNLKNGIIQFDDLIYISEDAHKLLWKSEVKPETVLLSMSGTIGEVAIALPEYSYPMNSNQDIAKIDFNGNFNPYFAYIFLLSKYGQNYLRREARGSVQQHVFLSQIENFKLPVLTIKFQERIEIIVKDIHYKLKKSATKYSKAEKLLLSELGLENFNPSNEKVSIKTLKESFLKTGRLDSEYYQPKYDEILNKITKYGCSEFTNFVDSYTTGYPYSSDSYVEKDGIVLIKISNINNFKLDISSASLIPKNDIDLSAENVVQKNDILVSMSGTIGNSCIVQDDIKAVVNQRIMKIKSKNINPVVFSLIINSMIGKNQLERIQTGGVQANISPKDILKIQIPCIKTSVQDEIASYIKQSMEYSKKAKELLEISTKSVETAIDKDEQAAHNFLEQNRTEQNRL